VARARKNVRSTLNDWGLSQLEETAELLASELVTNALLYTNGPISVRLLRDNSLLCEVYDTSDETPQLRAADHDDDGGRGLHLVKALSQRWGTRRTSGGKSVWFELALP
jgi:anti-sigma regulatory factor (Ser/Thr protein kinase)